MSKSVVVDKNGVELKAGQKVLVHQPEETREAIVIETFPDNPTIELGHWVDININNTGIEGMPSYLLEVIE